MTSKEFDLKIIIDENRNVVVNRTGGKLLNDNFMRFEFISYLSINLEVTIADLISQMIKDEMKIIFENNSFDSSASKRDTMIRDIVSKFEKQLRKRLSENKDYLIPFEMRGKKRIDFLKEKTVFSKKFAEACDELRNENKRLSKINIAQKIYKGDYSNYYKWLERKLNELNWKFEDVRNAYLERYERKISEIAEPPICLNCKHFNREPKRTKFACKAFPHGIPFEIVLSEFDHRNQHISDGGKRYEPIQKDYPLPSNLGLQLKGED